MSKISKVIPIITVINLDYSQKCIYLCTEMYIKRMPHTANVVSVLKKHNNCTVNPFHFVIFLN